MKSYGRDKKKNLESYQKLFYDYKSPVYLLMFVYNGGVGPLGGGLRSAKETNYVNDYIEKTSNGTFIQQIYKRTNFI